MNKKNPTLHLKPLSTSLKTSLRKHPSVRFRSFRWDLDLFCFCVRNYATYIMMITWRGSHDICTSETSVVVMLSHVILTSCDLQVIVWLCFLWHHRLWMHVVHTDSYEGTATQMKVYTCVSAGGASIKLP